MAEAHRLAVENIDKFTGVLNLGTSNGTSVKEIIDIAENITGKKCPVIIEGRRAGDPAILSATSGKAKEILGWKPKLTMEDIIKTAWNWELNKKY